MPFPLFNRENLRPLCHIISPSLLFPVPLSYPRPFKSGQCAFDHKLHTLASAPRRTPFFRQRAQSFVSSFIFFFFIIYTLVHYYKCETMRCNEMRLVSPLFFSFRFNCFCWKGNIFNLFCLIFVFCVFWLSGRRRRWRWWWQQRRRKKSSISQTQRNIITSNDCVSISMIAIKKHRRRRRFYLLGFGTPGLHFS